MKKLVVSIIAFAALTPAFALDMNVAPSSSTAPAAAPPAAPASDVSLDELSLGTGVENRQILGQAASFPAGTEMVFCLTAVRAKATPTTVKHVWYKDGAALGEVVLNVGGSPWRTWSRHFVQPGAWKVEVQDEAGTVVQSAEFTVGQ